MAEQIVQLFEGYVESVDHETGDATVVLLDATNPTYPDELAVIDFRTVRTNLVEVEPGHVFKWRIGHLLDDNGKEVSKINEFVFQRYTEEDLAAIAEAFKNAPIIAAEIRSMFE